MLGYADPTNALYGWQSEDEKGTFWLFRWLADLKVWSTEYGNTFPSELRVGYHTGTGHSRGPGVQGFPTMLLGGPGAGQAIRVEQAARPPAEGPYQRGDLVFHAPAAYNDPANTPSHVGWVCVDDSDPANLVWKPFGSIEP